MSIVSKNFVFHQNIFTEWEVSMLGYADDYIWNQIRQFGTFYELDLLRYIGRIISLQHKRNSLVVDVGANIGNHSVFFGKFLESKVIAIEPNPIIIDLLQQNLTRNKVEHKIFNNAIGQCSGYGVIKYFEAQPNNYGMARIEYISTNKLSDHFEISIYTLDEIIFEQCDSKEFDKGISVLKIDVEGMELQVLMGANKVISTYKPNIFVEASTESDKYTIDAYLKKFSYTSVAKLATTPVYHYMYRPNFSQRLFSGIYSFLISTRKWIKKFIQL